MSAKLTAEMLGEPVVEQKDVNEAARSDLLGASKMVV